MKISEVEELVGITKAMPGLHLEGHDGELPSLKSVRAWTGGASLHGTDLRLTEKTGRCKNAKTQEQHYGFFDEFVVK